MQRPPGTAKDVYIIGKEEDPRFGKPSGETQLLFSALVRTNKIVVQPALGFVCTGVFRELRTILPLPEELLKQELLRLGKEKAKLTASLEKLRTKLSNPEFVGKAPLQLIEKQRQQRAHGEKELEEITQKTWVFSSNFRMKKTRRLRPEDRVRQPPCGDCLTRSQDAPVLSLHRFHR